MAGNHSNRTQVGLNTVRCSEESRRFSLSLGVLFCRLSPLASIISQQEPLQPVMISTVYFNRWCTLSSEAQRLLNRGWERSSDTIDED